MSQHLRLHPARPAEPFRGGYPEPFQGRHPEPFHGRYPEPFHGRHPEPFHGRYPEPFHGRHPEPFQGRHPEPKAKDPCIWGRHRSFRKTLCLAGLLILGCAIPARAQGCAQCLDATHAAPPAVQAAYRHAIYLLGGTGALLFVAGALVIRRER